MSKGKIKYGVIPIVMVIGLLVALKTGLLPFGHAKNSVTPPSTVSIIASEVEYRSMTPKLLLTGSIEGETIGAISAKIAGRIAEVLVEDGQRVTAGQPLVRLESVELVNGVDMAKDNVRRLQASYDNTATDYNRYKTLYDEKAVSKQQLDNAETKLKMAEMDLSTAYAGLSNSKKQYDYGNVAAPVNGVVANKTAVIGQVVSAGLALMTVQNIDQVYAVVNIEQKDMGTVKSGMGAEVAVDAYPGRVFPGVVDIINPVAANSNRMFRVKIKINNTDHLLKPGMFVKTGIILGAETQALFVPQSAIFQKQGYYYVYVVQDGKVIKQQVEVGSIKEDYIEVKSGVKEKTIIATSNINTLKDGDSVIVMK